jgi:hypothetical protein
MAAFCVVGSLLWALHFLRIFLRTPRAMLRHQKHDIATKFTDTHVARTIDS